MKKLIITLCLMLLPLQAFGYGSIINGTTETCKVSTARYSTNGFFRVDLDWTSNSGGTVAATLTSFYGGLIRVSFNPGDASPTTLYDITIKDADNYDILGGNGANLSATANSAAWISDATTGYQPWPVAGDLTFAGSSMGNAKAGRVILWMKN